MRLFRDELALADEVRWCQSLLETPELLEWCVYDKHYLISTLSTISLLFSISTVLYYHLSTPTLSLPLLNNSYYYITVYGITPAPVPLLPSQMLLNLPGLDPCLPPVKNRKYWKNDPNRQIPICKKTLCNTRNISV